MNLSGKKILITGGCGLVGSHIADACVREGAEVIIFDNLARGKENHIRWAKENGSVHLVTEDIQNQKAVNQATQGVDYVFHQAAAWLRKCQEHPRLSLDVNIVGTFNVLEACVACGVKKIIAASSSSVYGEGLYLPTDEKHPFNNDLFYGASKVANEQYYRSFYKKFGLDYIAFRYLNVYGPRQPYEAAYTDVIMNFFNRVEANEPPMIRGDGSSTIDMVFVEDVARANLLALKSSVTDEVFNVASGQETTLNELAHLIIDLCGKTNVLKPNYQEMDQGLVTRRWGCPKKAKEKIGFSAQTPIKEGLRKIFEWRQTLKQ